MKSKITSFICIMLLLISTCSVAFAQVHQDTDQRKGTQYDYSYMGSISQLRAVGNSSSAYSTGMNYSGTTRYISTLSVIEYHNGVIRKSKFASGYVSSGYGLMTDSIVRDYNDTLNVYEHNLVVTYSAYVNTVLDNLKYTVEQKR